MGWFWALRGWELLLTTLGLIAGAVGTVFMAFIGVMKGINHLVRTSGHQWRTCQCPECRQRRYKARKARGDTVTGVKPNGDLEWNREDVIESGNDTTPKSGWLTTRDLIGRANAVVRHGGKVFVIQGVELSHNEYWVRARHVTGARDVVTFRVKARNGDIRWWEPIR